MKKLVTISLAAALCTILFSVAMAQTSPWDVSPWNVSPWDVSPWGVPPVPRVPEDEEREEGSRKDF